MRTSTRRQLTTLAASAAIIALVLGGCAKKKEEAATPPPSTPAATSPTPSPTPTPEPTPEATEAPIIWPLTGVATDNLKERPAVSVKIENSPESRPQTGLEDADLVFEEIVEGGIPRFVAVWHSTLPKEIGPIRSVRPMDPAIVAPIGGVFAFSGGQGQFVAKANRIASIQVLSMDAGSGGFYRTSNRAAPHNVYANPHDFVRAADKKHSKPPKQQWQYAADAATSSARTAGEGAAKVALTLSGGSHPAWQWDEAAGKFLRFEGSDKAVSTSGDQLAATNVIVLKTKQTIAPGKDPAGNPIPETLLTQQSGTGVVLTGGSIVEVNWSKGTNRSLIELTLADGSPVLLAPGNTWIELGPEATTSWDVTAS
jgi:hypothetical protein